MRSPCKWFTHIACWLTCRDSRLCNANPSAQERAPGDLDFISVDISAFGYSRRYRALMMKKVKLKTARREKGRKRPREIPPTRKTNSMLEKLYYNGEIRGAVRKESSNFHREHNSSTLNKFNRWIIAFASLLFTSILLSTPDTAVPVRTLSDKSR